jgi:hypothetical protein
MTFAHNAACLVAGALALTACSKPANAPAASATAAGAAPADSATVTVSEMPDMKAGLWETRLAHTGGPGTHSSGTTQICLDAAAMAEAKTTAATYMKAHCSGNEITRSGDTWTDVLVCKAGEVTSTTRTVTTMTGDTAYHTELATSYHPMTPDMPASTTTVDGKYLGPCKA